MTDKAKADEKKSFWANVAKFGKSEPVKVAVSRKDVAESIKNADFLQGVDSSLVNKVLAGGEESAAALAELLNSVQRSTFASAMEANSTMTEKALEKFQQQLDARINGVVQNNAAASAVTSKFRNLMADETYGPLVEAFTSAVISNNPSATPGEIASQVEQKLQEFAGKVSLGDGSESNANEAAMQSANMAAAFGVDIAKWQAQQEAAPVTASS